MQISRFKPAQRKERFMMALKRMQMKQREEREREIAAKNVVPKILFSNYADSDAVIEIPNLEKWIFKFTKFPY